MSEVILPQREGFKQGAIFAKKFWFAVWLQVKFVFGKLFGAKIPVFATHNQSDFFFQLQANFWARGGDCPPEKDVWRLGSLGSVLRTPILINYITSRTTMVVLHLNDVWLYRVEPRSTHSKVLMARRPFTYKLDLYDLVPSFNLRWIEDIWHPLKIHHNP